MSSQRAPENQRGTENDRQQKRVSLAVDVTMASDHNFYTGLANNISEGGIFVATYMPPPVGEIVEIFVELGLQQSRATFVIKGQVQWIRFADAASDGLPPGCGLKFVALPKAALAVIRDFVRQRETIFYDSVA